MSKDFRKWFHDHSLRFKLISLFLIFIIFIQLITALLVAGILQKRARQDLMLSNQGILEQMADHLDKNLTYIVEDLYPIIYLTKSMQQEPISQDYTGFYNYRVQFQKLFNELIASRNNYKYINSLLILTQQKGSYSYAPDRYRRLNQVNLFYKTLHDTPDDASYYWTEIRSDGYFFQKPQQDIFSLVIPVGFYKEKSAFIILNINVSEVEKYLSSIAGTNKGIFLELESGQYIFGNAFTKDLITKNKDINNRNQTNLVQIDNNTVLLRAKLVVNQWDLLLVYDMQNGDKIEILLRMLIGLLCVSALFMVLGSGVIVSVITIPLRKLTKIMQENGSNHTMDLRFQAKYSDEVGVLGDTYNKMMDAIQNEQFQSRMAYLRMLQMQIKPHFLYNSLESARFLAQVKDERAGDMIHAIAMHYRHTLGDARETVPLQEEIEHLDFYLKILHFRYASKYDYQILIDDEIKDVEIEKFILQPIVENSIYHGIKNKREKGLVTITGKRSGQNIILEIFDNGQGIEKEKLEEIYISLKASLNQYQSDSIGIINVQHRLQTRYGEAYGLDIVSRFGEFTRVTITIPYSDTRGVALS